MVSSIAFSPTFEQIMCVFMFKMSFPLILPRFCHFVLNKLSFRPWTVLFLKMRSSMTYMIESLRGNAFMLFIAGDVREEGWEGVNCH